MLIDFPMTGNGLADLCPGILVPIMPTAMTDHDASALFDAANKIDSFHAI